MTENIVVLIPAYKPSGEFVEVVESLLRQQFSPLVVVDDGSGPAYAETFAAVQQHDGVILLTHEVNKGKGAALKTGLSYIYDELPEYQGVVTADADGQHTPEDIRKVAQVTAENPNALVLGARQFEEMVFHRRIGNAITHWVFRIFFALNLTDTQTGLRGMGRDFIPACLEIPYDGYEFESEMLLITRGERVKTIDVPIRTLYVDDNKGSHFNILVDSSKIYFVLFRYTIASLVSAAVDYLIFYLLFLASASIPLSIFGARLVSLVVNYLLLQYKVFYSRRRPRVTFPRYVALVAFSGVAATLLIELFTQWLGWGVIGTKLIVETAIYFFNFSMNTLLVFVNRSRAKSH